MDTCRVASLPGGRSQRLTPSVPAVRKPLRQELHREHRDGSAYASRTAPEHMTDGTPAQFEPFESGYSPSDPVDRAIMATRNAIFPLHGLMPL